MASLTSNIGKDAIVSKQSLVLPEVQNNLSNVPSGVREDIDSFKQYVSFVNELLPESPCQSDSSIYFHSASLNSMSISGDEAQSSDEFRRQAGFLRAHCVYNCRSYVNDGERSQLQPAARDKFTDVLTSYEALLREDQRRASGRPDSGYLTEFQTNLTSQMRTIVIDWMVTAHQRCRAPAVALHFGVALLDRYLRCCGVQFSHTRIQLAACACLSLGCKLDDAYTPTLASFSHLTDLQWSKSDIAMMETEVQGKLGFFLNYATSLQFAYMYLTVFSNTRQIDSVQNNTNVISFTPAKSRQLRCLIEYLCELALLHEDLLDIPPHLQGAAVLCYALMLLSTEYSQCWTIAQEIITGINIGELCDILTLMSTTFHKIQSESLLQLHGTINKYNSSEYTYVGAFTVVLKPRVLLKHQTQTIEAMNAFQSAYGVSSRTVRMCSQIRSSCGSIAEIVDVKNQRGSQVLGDIGDSQDIQQYQAVWRQYKVLGAGEGISLFLKVWCDQEWIEQCDGGFTAVEYYNNKKKKGNTLKRVAEEQDQQKQEEQSGGQDKGQNKKKKSSKCVIM